MSEDQKTLLPNCRIIMDLYSDGEKILLDDYTISIFIPDLITKTDAKTRSTSEWYEESIGEDFPINFKYYMPKNIEICEDGVTIEVLCHVKIDGHIDSYYGEYDEDIDVEVLDWHISFLAIDETELARK